MEFQDVVRHRRMVRNFSDEPVEKATIERLIRYARRAPSAGFSQGVYFVVVSEASTRRAIAALANEDEYASKGFDRWISTAPVHIAVCVSEADYHERYNEPDKLENGKEVEWPIPYWWVDVGCSLMLLLLGAVDVGLAAGFVGTHRVGGLNELLGIPPSVTPIGVVTIGHPSQDRRSSSLDRGRKPADEVVRWERW